MENENGSVTYQQSVNDLASFLSFWLGSAVLVVLFSDDLHPGCYDAGQSDTVYSLLMLENCYKRQGVISARDWEDITGHAKYIKGYLSQPGNLLWEDTADLKKEFVDALIAYLYQTEFRASRINEMVDSVKALQEVFLYAQNPEGELYAGMKCLPGNDADSCQQDRSEEVANA